MSVMETGYMEVRMGGLFRCPRCGQMRTSCIGSCPCDMEDMEKENRRRDWENTPSEIRRRAIEEYEKELRKDLSGDNGETVPSRLMKALSNIFGWENLRRRCESVDEMREMFWLNKPKELSAGLDWMKKRREVEDKLLELLYMGYGGVITESEWESLDSDNIWTIDRWGNVVSGAPYGSLLAFRTKDDAKRFAKHDDNIELVKKYYSPITEDIIKGKLEVEGFLENLKNV